ncbi:MULTISPECIES: hypothetical protein [unclassified Moraxella]|uniref:hypothetical protein n=1 Tax=unclassified Moraxella TaxID=2685852 RepID=UPI003AF668BE
MTDLYKDTTPQPKRSQVANGEHGKGMAMLCEIIHTLITVTMLAGVLLLVIHCQPLHAKNKLLSVVGIPTTNNSLLNNLDNKNLHIFTDMGDNTDLSKNNSGQASRYPLAFFVPKSLQASQATNAKDTTHLPPFLGVNHHIMPSMAISYGGVTLQNKRKPICRAVTIVTESEPHHPMIFHSVVTTQKTIGGHYHA